VATHDACADLDAIDQLLAEVEMCDAMRNLAVSLALAGALCASFFEGFIQADLARSYHDYGYRLESMWQPGCGREMP
jgi:hypothetical protein